MRTQVVAVMDRIPEQPYYCYAEFLKSLERFGHTPKILGMGEHWGGLMTKPRKLKAWLDSGGADDIDCLIVCDSWDLVFAASPNDVANKWSQIGQPWLIGGERNLFPDGGRSRYPKTQSSFRFPNSGFIVSSPNDMKKMLEWMRLENIPDDHVDLFGTSVHPNDQFYYQQAYLAEPVPTKVDSECEFVANLCGVDLSNFDFSADQILMRETNSYPMAFHANGGAKTDGVMDKILEHLKLK